MQKPELILGTAEFSHTPYGNGVIERLTLNDINYILKCAKQGGIRILEGADLYNCDDVLQHDFDLIYKVRHPYNLGRVLNKLGRHELLGLLYHHGHETQSQEIRRDPRVLYRGASVYAPGQLDGTEDMIEVPLNLENRQFEKMRSNCKLVRSVFGRGELLKKYSVKECLDFVKTNPTVHGVIVGVNNVKELEEVLNAWSL